MTQKRIELVCPRCGAAEMCRDANTRWSVEEQDWVLTAVYDNMTCDACGEEPNHCDKIDLDTLPEEGAKEWIELALAALAKPETNRTITEKYLVWAGVEHAWIEPKREEGK